MSHIGPPPCDGTAILHGEVSIAPCSPAARRWTLVAAILGSSLAFIDGTVVNVALPAIGRELNASASELQWVMESYALLLAALLLVGGTLGDRYGRKRMFMVGVALFTAASVACALSGTAALLIYARALQGAGAALMVPGSLALISAAFPQKERGAAIGTWSAFSGITAAIGPVIGGALVEHYSWTWAFLVNLPLGVLLLAICALRVPESRGGDAGGPIDLAGAVLATMGLAGVVYALIQAPAQGWTHPGVIGAGVSGMAAIACFLRVEAKSAAPMLPLALFREPNFAGANLLTVLLYAALGGGLFFLPLNLIQVQGMGATGAGAALLPFIAIMFVLSRWAGTLVDRVGAKLPLVIGPLIAALGFALFMLPGVGANYWTTFLPAVCVLGLGMSVTVAPLTTTVMNAVGPGRAGMASGVNNAVSRAAGLLAIAAFGIVLAWAFKASLVDALGVTALAKPPPEVAAVLAQSSRLAGIVIPEGVAPATAQRLRETIGSAFVAGFRWVMGLSALLALLSALSAWMWIDGKEGAARPP
jgi:EmrB/QacA subfamily drug resistance transporter